MCGNKAGKNVEVVVKGIDRYEPVSLRRHLTSVFQVLRIQAHGPGHLYKGWGSEF